jgi:hypothetical protein
MGNQPTNVFEAQLEKVNDKDKLFGLVNVTINK